ncbi:hypothetical protein L9F63_024169, partial [Diploptera punctata]
TTVLNFISSFLCLHFHFHRQWEYRFFRKAAKLPTKKSHPIFGHIFDVMVPPNRLLETLDRVRRENAPIFAVWIIVPVVMMTKPKHIEAILGSPKHITKSLQYKPLKSWLGTGLLTSAGSKWHTHRKMLTPAFHFKTLENFVNVFSDKSQILVEKLEKEINAEHFDVVPYISMCTLDIICETAMGVEINAQEHGHHSEYVNQANNITNEIAERSAIPWLYLDFIYYRTQRGKLFRKYIKRMHTFTMESSYAKAIVQARECVNCYKLRDIVKKFSADGIQSDGSVIRQLMGTKKRLTFLDLLLETSNDGAVLTDEEVREEVDTFMFEGHDTTAAGISWTLQLLGSHLDVQDKVYMELEHIYLGSTRSCTMEDLNKMKYLERVIKEALRLYPSVPIIGRRVQEDVIF